MAKNIFGPCAGPPPMIWAGADAGGVAMLAAWPNPMPAGDDGTHAWWAAAEQEVELVDEEGVVVEFIMTMLEPLVATGAAEVAAVMVSSLALLLL